MEVDVEDRLAWRQAGRQLVRSAQGGFKLLPAEDMQVQVKHRLACDTHTASKMIA